MRHQPFCNYIRMYFFVKWHLPEDAYNVYGMEDEGEN